MIRKVAFTYENQDVKVCPKCGEDEDISIDSAWGMGSDVTCDSCGHKVQSENPAALKGHNLLRRFN